MPSDKEEEPDWKDTIHIRAEDPQTKQQVINLSNEFKEMWSGHPGQIKATARRINLLPDAQPVYQQPFGHRVIGLSYRAGMKAREVEKAEVERILKEVVVEPPDSEWASPVVLIPKLDGTLRFSVDYRRLNALTIIDSYSILRMHEGIDSLVNVEVLYTLDANCGY